jgi:hypothetical protein
MRVAAIAISAARRRGGSPALWTAIAWATVGMLGGVATLAFAEHVRPRHSARIVTVPIALPAKKSATSHGPWFSQEVSLLAQCRKELYQGNSLRALEALDRYSREFPLGELVPEALLLRVEVLRARGDHTRARALANQFVAHNPQSRYAAAMRKLMAEARPK